MRAAIYLDPLGPDDGCLSVIAGSHFAPFREALEASVEELGLAPEELPGRHPLVNEPGDVIFMNHKTFHAALGDRPGRRAIHVNAVQNARRTGRSTSSGSPASWAARPKPGAGSTATGWWPPRPAPAADAGSRHRAGLRHHGRVTHLQELRWTS